MEKLIWVDDDYKGGKILIKFDQKNFKSFFEASKGFFEVKFLLKV